MNLKKVAVTGTLSTGKSSVCQFFKELGAYVAKADQIVHEQLSPNTQVGKQVISLLGPEIVANGQIDRIKIAKKVFNHPKHLRQLEEILHPIVYEELEKIYQAVQKEKKATLFVAEIPLLFESKGEQYYDGVIAVTAPREFCWDRFRSETGYEREEFNRRMARQLSQEEKTKRADFVIHNDGTLEELKKQVINLYQQITQTEEKDS